MWDELAPPKWGQSRLMRVDDQFNASIAERSRFLGLGLPEVVITIGLPMLHALDEPQVRAVVAHEVGHDACRHTLGLSNLVEFERAFNWVFWLFPPHSTVTGEVLSGLLGWLGDWLQAEQLRLSRIAERDADANAAKAIGLDSYAESLATFAAHAERFNEQFVKATYEGLDHHMHVPPSPLEAFLGESGRLTCSELSPYADIAFAKPHDPARSHPVLAEALAAVGYDHLPPLKELGPRALDSVVSPSVVSNVRSYYHARWERYVSRYLQLN